MHPLANGRKVLGSALLLLSVYGLGLYLCWRGDSSIAQENALMENLQAGGLMLACLLLLPCVIKPAAAISRFACWSLLLVMLSMFLREVNVESLAVPQPIAWLGSGTGRNLSLGTAFAATLIVLIRQRHSLTGPLIRFVYSHTGLLLFAGCALYLASLPFDKALGLSFHFNQFCEEVVECGATLMFLLATGVNFKRYAVALRTKPAPQPSSVSPARIAA